MFIIKEVSMQHNNGTSVRHATNSTLWEDLSQDNAQERECGSAFHRSNLDKAGTSTSARGLSRGTGRRTRLRAGRPSRPRTLSGRERCGIDRGGGGGWRGRALFAGEVGALEKRISAPDSLNWLLMYIPRRWVRVHSTN